MTEPFTDPDTAAAWRSMQAVLPGVDDPDVMKGWATLWQVVHDVEGAADEWAQGPETVADGARATAAAVPTHGNVPADRLVRALKRTADIGDRAGANLRRLRNEVGVVCRLLDELGGDGR